MENMNIGLIGCGTVGSGVIAWLQDNKSLITSRCGITLTVHKIAVSDIGKPRGVSVPRSHFTNDPNSVINDPEIDVIVELMGGITVAKGYVIQALELGKPVVTANKALLAYHGKELFAIAEKNNADIYYEASVGGGITVIKSLREGLAANKINRIYGILNGTCNYILTRMKFDRIDFPKALEEAQQRGYAESDPSLDIGGEDAAHKTCILASLAYGEWFDMNSIYIEGIRNLNSQDIRYAGEAGYTIKLLGIIRHDEGDIQMRVHPTLIPATSMLAKVNDVYNAVWISGDVVGESMYYGQGAGKNATASAVIADLIDVALNLKFDSSLRVAAFRPHISYDRLLAMEEITCRFYLRLSVDDKPDVLAKITHILGEGDISIASILQKESESEELPVILITHTAKEANIQQAIKKIEQLSVVHGNAVLIRIEDM